MEAVASNQPLLLEIDRLTVDFGTGRRARPAVRGVSLRVYERQTVGIVGESGSGKSATALAILRLLPSPPAVITGRAIFKGDDLLKATSDRLRHVRGGEIGVVFQDPMSSLNPALTVGFQIAEALRVHTGMSRHASAARAIELLELVGIPDARTRSQNYPHQFSGGMRQRAMIAMALSCRPVLLIADEPTTALDVTIQAQILELLRRLRDEFGMALLLITHDFGVVAGMVDTIHVMYAGQVVETGPVKDVFRHPGHPYTDGLLHSLPQLGVDKHSLLPAIEGNPTDASHALPGCPFRPRCPIAVDRCAIDNPPLMRFGATQLVACWVRGDAVDTG